MTDSWTGIIVGSFGLVVAAVLVAGHYRREWARRRQLSPTFAVRRAGSGYVIDF